MKYLIFILSLLSLMVAAVFLVIALGSCAPNADAGTRVEWFPIDDSTSMGIVKELHTDGQR
ncbi:MAG: hypothetical protein OXI86_20610, partial [Candidatus Poribacteria bacterium]|nr:hypothetical protein [Candidatus Poribacteria bacterium]